MGQYLTPEERAILHILRQTLAIGLIVALGALVTALTHGATLQGTVIAVVSSFATVMLGAVGKYLRATKQTTAAGAIQGILNQLPGASLPQTPTPPVNTSPTQQPPPSMPVNQG